MGITTTEQMLLIILSATLAMFLIISIIIGIKTIQILNHVKSIITKAEQIADKAESVTEFFQKTAAPVAIGRLLSNIFNATKDRK